MKEENCKKYIKIDRMDYYIQRYRENIRLQEQLEQKRNKSFFSYIFKKDKVNHLY